MPIKLSSLYTAIEIKGKQSLKGIVGTSLYMAPEVLLGKPYDKAVDMWSAGIIMYMLFTGSHPIINLKAKIESPDSYQEILNQSFLAEDIDIIDEAKPEVEHINKDALNLISQLLSIDPDERITAKCALKHSWINSFGRINCKGNIKEIEDLILETKDLHDRILYTISTSCLPPLKTMLLDRMCCQSKYARENGFPSVDPNLLSFYRELFYFLDNKGIGFLSKQDFLNRIVYSNFSEITISKCIHR